MSEDQKPQSPPTPVPAGPPQWARQMCPILSLATLSRAKPEASRLVAVGVPQPAQPEPEATGCQGPQCAWFVPIADEKGQVTGGGCAAALIAPALSGLVNIGTAKLAMQGKGAQPGHRPYPVKGGR